MLNVSFQDPHDVFQMCHTTVCIKIKVINFQRPIVLKSIDLNICMWPISKEQLIFFPLIYTLLTSCLSRMTEYIAIEDDFVISHFLQVLVLGMADCSECRHW